jgi:UDP-N-acetylglucosamine 2-epimerase (hydrolysing)
MKKIVFLSGTRADFGKLKSLINATVDSKSFEVHIFVTGMHLHNKYGYTVEEIVKCGYKNIYRYINFTSESSMDQTLSKTVQGFSDYVREIKPDLIIIHGDRVEALAGAITGALNNVLVAHIEGGEISGTVDELIRHAVSKLSHIHLVANDLAKKRLIQMGELNENIFVIGSPDIDVMMSDKLPDLEKVKKWYEIEFDNYALALFHPVTTEIDKMDMYANNFVNALIESNEKYIVVYPNNDLGSNSIFRQYERLKNNTNFKLFPSIRFEYFIVLLKNSKFIIGNSSCGIREAPYYGLPVINIGNRQNNRAFHDNIFNCDNTQEDILKSIKSIDGRKFGNTKMFGHGNSDKLFLDIIANDAFWEINKQKQFKDISF